MRSERSGNSPRRGSLPALLQRRLVLPVYALLVAAAISVAAPAQLPTLFSNQQQGSNCANTAAGCGDQQMGQSIGAPDYSQGATSGSRTQQDTLAGANGNAIYVDGAGSADTARRPEDRPVTPLLFPPDPLTDLQQLARAATGETLPVFGRDLFQNVPSTFAPGDQLAVTPDYVLGPGDEVLLRMWGPETFNSELTVDRSGAIYIPKVGSVHVAGLRFDELQQQVTSAVKRVYRNFNLTVNLGRLRSIQVYLVGEARRPGAYTISSLSTVLNALFASGGPGVRGSMRHIQIRRGSTVLPEFDLYDLVLRGEKSKDVRLESGDTIFIPAVGPQVALGGSVRHPALYELKAGNTLQEVLDLAGGLSAVGTASSFTLDRIGTDATRHTVTVALDAAGKAMALQDGDVIYAGHISPGYEKTVTIRGNLANPGRFAWHPGMRLNEIIPDRMSLLTNNYWRERNRLGVPVPLFEPQPVARQQDQQYDRQRSTQNSARQQQGSATVENYLYDPVNTADPGMGPRNQAASASTRPTLRPNDEAADSVELLGPAIGGLTALQDPNQQVVSGNTTGSAQTPTQRTPPRQQSPVDAAPVNRIQLAAPEINWGYAVIERLDADTLKSSLVPFHLGRLVQEHDAAQNLELQPGDVVTILSQKDVPVSLDAQTKYIRLEGEFVSPGVYSAQPGETLESLVGRAGGFTPRAYLYGSSFLRESARVFQQQRLDEYISHLSLDMERALAVRAVSSASGVLDPTSLAEQRNLISQLRQMRATGRVVLAFQPDSAGVGTVPPLTLENGDVFRVPSVPGTISVIGAVFGQNVFLYNPKSKMQDYLSLAGRPNRIADKKSAFIIRADGSVFSRIQANSVFSNKFDSAHINPGDSIVIPEKLIRPTALRQLIDFSQILSSFGLAAAAINVVR